MSRKTRKLMWSVPLIAAVAAIGALAIFVALQPNGVQADHVDLPGTPTDVTAKAMGRSEVTVTWKAPSSGGTPDYYRIDRSSGDNAGDVWMRLVQMHTDSTLSISDTDGIKPGTAYHYRVFAVNVAGTGQSSSLTEKSLDTTDAAEAPGPVLTLTSTAAGPNQIDLSWYPPADNGGAAVTRYCIATKGGAGTLPTATDVTGNCTHTTPPTSGSALTAISVGTATPPVGDGAGTIVIAAPDAAGKVTYMHTKLLANNAREYQVYAVNRVGISSAASAKRTLSTEAAKTPSAPRQLRAVVTGDADTDDDGNLDNPGVSLYWNWPANDGGAPVTSFTVQKSEAGAAAADVGGGTVAAPADPTDGAGAATALITDTPTATVSNVKYIVKAVNGTGATAKTGPAAEITLRFPFRADSRPGDVTRACSH